MLIMNSSELFDLHRKTVLITGGSGVLGRVMASGLAQAGARVAVLGRREEPALAVAASIRVAGGEALGVAADVLDRTALERANETITATLGPVDILINGAGGNQPQATTGPDRTFFDLYERLPATVAALHLVAFTCLMLHQLIQYSLSP
jgi:NAD(P)-dependent dehydrogenase (short-subunit alcohol dehydrogenase family)